MKVAIIVVFCAWAVVYATLEIYFHFAADHDKSDKTEDIEKNLDIADARDRKLKRLRLIALGVLIVAEGFTIVFAYRDEYGSKNTNTAPATAPAKQLGG
jgi:hypothetical protein